MFTRLGIEMFILSIFLQLLSPTGAWPDDRNENSQLHRNFKPSGENSPPSSAADVFLQDVEGI